MLIQLEMKLFYAFLAFLFLFYCITLHWYDMNTYISVCRLLLKDNNNNASGLLMPQKEWKLAHEQWKISLVAAHHNNKIPVSITATAATDDSMHAYKQDGMDSQRCIHVHLSLTVFPNWTLTMMLSEGQPKKLLILLNRENVEGWMNGCMSICVCVGVSVDLLDIYIGSGFVAFTSADQPTNQPRKNQLLLAMVLKSNLFSYYYYIVLFAVT